MRSDGAEVIERGGAGRELHDFASFYDDQFVSMVRLATLTIGQPEVARDIVQDAFVGLHDRWNRVDFPKAYVRRSVINGCRSRMRWERIRHPLATTTPGLDPGERAVDQVVDEMTDVLAVLSVRQRAAVVLKFYEQRTEVEIADAIGCRPGSVGPLVSRALVKLRNELGDWRDLEGGTS
ncbi:MAG: sigma-70 family RNA polymerase sigma factor [Ilumatobacter sp.]|uniref:sigma-70 family RNA polymerase sigma factor n=1 Tax=Ilumatobacter sp. TaxID=1967498 RepID=UPI003296C6A1